MSTSRPPAWSLPSLLAAAVLVLGCARSSFVCETHGDCRDGGEAGACEPSGACSFPDPNCPSGRRYGALGDRDVAGECVDDELADTGSSSASTDLPSSTAQGGSESVSTDSGGLEDTRGESDCPDGWWDCDWTRRHRIVLANPVPSKLVDVPVAIVLGPSRISYGDTLGLGADVRFIADDGTLLAHEVERWDPAGVSIVWVSVPSLGAEGMDGLWIYYGNATATDSADPTLVWSPAHAGVWHLDSDELDATDNGNDGVAARDLTRVAGYVAGAVELRDGGDRIDVAASASLDDVFATGGTASAWLRPDTFGGNEFGRILDKSADDDRGWILYVGDGGALRFRQPFDGDGSLWESPPGSLTLHAWQHVAVTFDAGSGEGPRLYVDGVAQVVTMLGNAPVGAPLSDADIALVVANNVPGSRWFDGRIDEIRLESVERSPEWIAVQYASMRDGLFEHDPQQRLEDAP